VPSWTFLTSHARVLLHISHGPESTGLEIAQAVGITERAARKIIAELQEAGYISAERVGRRNRYYIDSHQSLGRIGEQMGQATRSRLTNSSVKLSATTRCGSRPPIRLTEAASTIIRRTIRLPSEVPWAHSE
jgi:DNA-binding transcriptional ArsR family regulator